MPKYKNLFLQQSYRDSYEEYKKSLTKPNYPLWDYVILTASNEAQAEFYRMQIKNRLKDGKLPSKTHFAVLSDPDGKRVGSGGATLNVLRYVSNDMQALDFNKVKILCIHSGGDSKRVPQYSACGKLFSPVPRELPDGRRSTLFDEFLIGMSGVPTRMSGGMLVCSGDVLLLFNPLQLDFYSKGAAALSIKESVFTGKNHGVFLGDENGNVKRFLHKQSVETLRELGATDEHDNVNIDTGAVIFDGTLLNDMYRLIDSDEKFSRYVNDTVRLSFYADFLYPLAVDANLDDYLKETPEGEFSDELEQCRRELWCVLHKYGLKLLRFAPASFIHFGTTAELLKLMTDDMPSYGYLDWVSNVNTNSRSSVFSSSNSYVSNKAKIGKGCYIENSYVNDCTVGEGCVISGVTLSNVQVPANTVLHGLKLKNGKFVVRMYAVDDNPKNNEWLGQKLDEPLWTCNLFTPCDTMEEAVRATLDGVKGDGMLSLSTSFNYADSTAIIQWESKLRDYVLAESLLEAIENNVSVDEVRDNFYCFMSDRIIDNLVSVAEALNENDLSEFGKKSRIYFYLSKITDGERKDLFYNKCFEIICKATLKSSEEEIRYKKDAGISRDKVTVRLPVRVNFGGGWSDTPPYCNENGGTVLNAALKLDGEYPIEANISRIKENVIILSSEDNGSYHEFDSIAQLRDCGFPGDPFALHKAALIVCGVIPRFDNGDSLQEILSHLGGGFRLSTQAINIPRGSGLGTSSILAAACVKAIYEFIGVELSASEVYSHVVCMEQLMSTGGGWQDQVGGFTKGFKLVSTTQGMKQNINCIPLCISPETLNELNDRFAIIYTGQRRLARNLLREIVGKYIGNDKTTVKVLREIQKLAVLMRFELEKGNVDEFAALLTEHWNYSKMLDGGCTNTCIDQIFNSIDDMVDGKMICGAGGGGFLQVVMKKGVTVDMLNERLGEIFSGSGVGVWKCEFDV